MTTQVDLIKKYRLSIRGTMGQHLLVDPNMQRKIVDVLDPQAEETILEIGPGLGALTGGILARGAGVIAVEKDARFAAVLQEEFAAAGSRFRLHHADILKTDLRNLLHKKYPQKKPLKVISNLPYYITAPILFQLIAARQLFSEAVLTMQKEVAARIVADPGTKEYGRLTLGVRYAADPQLCFAIPAGCFNPRPDVDSSVIRLVFHPPVRGIDEARLFRLIEIAFNQRRKTLIHILSKNPEYGIPRPRLEELFKRAGWALTSRAEEWMLKDFMELAKALEPEKGKD